MNELKEKGIQLIKKDFQNDFKDIYARKKLYNEHLSNYKQKLYLQKAQKERQIIYENEQDKKLKEKAKRRLDKLTKELES